MSLKFLKSSKKSSQPMASLNDQQQQVPNTNVTKYVKIKNVVYEQIELSLKLSKDEHKSSNSYGFVIAGYCPCHVETIVENSIAEKFGLKKGDLIIKVNEVNCCRARIKSILSLIKSNSNDNLKLTIYRCLNDAQKAFRISKRINLAKNNQNIKEQIESKKSKNINLITKLLRPSKWLSCAQPVNATMSTTFMYQSNTQEHTKENVLKCERDCCLMRKSCEKMMVKSESGLDTGYETLSRYYDSTEKLAKHNEESNYSIETVTNTTNSYSECDLTFESVQKKQNNENLKSTMNSESMKMDKFNQIRTKLIGDLIELEANFVSFLSVAVATFSRPLRGFFIQQQDYFTLFQNIEKILIISENFLRSMDKWSAYDLYTKIGQLYTQKMSLFKEAFATYVKGYPKARDLLNELKSHSKQFRLFLSEAQSNNLTLANLIDLPIVHMQKTMDLFKQIRMYTIESKRNPSEAPHIDSVIVELKKILNLINSNELKLNQVCYDDEIMENSEQDTELFEDEHELTEDSTSFFMEQSMISSINEMSTTLQDETYFNSTDSYASEESNSASC
ncbi:unnamed protein product [Brachionus calyciflorus]|uniref:Uncharacterized protein n=1 Tax=Brachionus calyciflorus TaxID=104777 RepID=A0A813XMK0_9BILA|nr:unnamed protein product [Brachionus calyciflorus]